MKYSFRILQFACFSIVLWVGCDQSQDVIENQTPESVGTSSLEAVNDSQVAVEEEVSSVNESPMQEVTPNETRQEPVMKQLEYDDSLGSIVMSGVLSSPSFSSDGTKIFVGDNNGELGVFATSNQDRLETWNLDSRIMQIVTSKTGANLAVTTDQQEILILDASTGKVISSFTHPSEPNNPDFLPVNTDFQQLQLSPNGEFAISTIFGHHDYFCWKTSTGKILWRSRCQWRDVCPCAFTPDGKHVALWSSKAISICDVTSGEPIRKIPFSYPINSFNVIQFTNDGKHLLLARTQDDETQLMSVSVSTGETHWSTKNSFSRLDTLVALNDGQQFAVVGSVDFNSDKIIEFRNLSDGLLTMSLQLPSHWSDPIIFSPDGKTFIVGRDLVPLPAKE